MNFTEEDGYTVKDLLQFGIDHLESSRILYSGGAHCFDSAGYLAQLGLELCFKALHLYANKGFNNTHNLVQLYKEIKGELTGDGLSADQLTTLSEVDKYYELRYPRKHDPVESGDEDCERALSIYDTLMEQMPEEVQEALKTINPLKKGGRVLMEKEDQGI